MGYKRLVVKDSAINAVCYGLFTRCDLVAVFDDSIEGAKLMIPGLLRYGTSRLHAYVTYASRLTLEADIELWEEVSFDWPLRFGMLTRFAGRPHDYQRRSHCYRDCAGARLGGYIHRQL